MSDVSNMNPLATIIIDMKLSGLKISMLAAAVSLEQSVRASSGT